MSKLRKQGRTKAMVFTEEQPQTNEFDSQVRVGPSRGIGVGCWGGE